MASGFNVHTADGYEQLMGRWSKMLAPPFIEFAGVADGERILDIGCGNGSLTFAILNAANVNEIMAVDHSPVFVAEVTRLNTDPRITVREADATALPFDDRTFARSLSLLVLHFVPDAERVISEMKRVVEPGGVVAAAVWDHLGGMPGMRMMLDTVAMLDDSGQAFRERFCFQPMTAPDEMKNAFIAQGLLDVEETSLLVRMTYESFEDYWKPIAEGEGPLGGYLANRNSPTRTRMESAVRDAYEAGRPDGRRSFVAAAWACRGIVPGYAFFQPVYLNASSFDWRKMRNVVSHPDHNNGDRPPRERSKSDKRVRVGSWGSIPTPRLRKLDSEAHKRILNVRYRTIYCRPLLVDAFARANVPVVGEDGDDIEHDIAAGSRGIVVRLRRIQLGY